LAANSLLNYKKSNPGVKQKIFPARISDRHHYPFELQHYSLILTPNYHIGTEPDPAPGTDINEFVHHYRNLEPSRTYNLTRHPEPDHPPYRTPDFSKNRVKQPTH
jgi:hypothetical protein